MTDGEMVGTLMAAALMFCLGLVIGTVTQSKSDDTQVLTACKTQGYWQTGQTRVICSIEGEKK